MLAKSNHKHLRSKPRRKRKLPRVAQRSAYCITVGECNGLSVRLVTSAYGYDSFVNVTTLPGGKRRMWVIFHRRPSWLLFLCLVIRTTPSVLAPLMILTITSIVHTETTVLTNMHLMSFAPIWSCLFLHPSSLLCDCNDSCWRTFFSIGIPIPRSKIIDCRRRTLLFSRGIGHTA